MAAQRPAASPVVGGRNPRATAPFASVAAPLPADVMEFTATGPCIHIADLEAAINHWRTRQPASSDAVLAPAVAVLAEVYASMVFQSQNAIAVECMSDFARDAWLAWYATTPDTPCIGVCTTSQGDKLCRGCGRTAGEVHEWILLSAHAKRDVWRRITQEGTALRFNRYAERAGRT